MFQKYSRVSNKSTLQYQIKVQFAAYLLTRFSNFFFGKNPLSRLYQAGLLILFPTKTPLSRIFWSCAGNRSGRPFHQQYRNPRKLWNQIVLKLSDGINMIEYVSQQPHCISKLHYLTVLPHQIAGISSNSTKWYSSRVPPIVPQNRFGVAVLLLCTANQIWCRGTFI